MMTSLSSNPSRHRFSQPIEPWAKSEDTESNINRELSSKMEMINANVVPPINKKLDFDILDGYDEENEGHAKSHIVAETQSKLTKSRSSDGIIRKRIDLDRQMMMYTIATPHQSVISNSILIQKTIVRVQHNKKENL